MTCHRLAGTEVTAPAIPSSHDGTRWLRHAYRERAPAVRGRGYFTWGLLKCCEDPIGRPPSSFSRRHDLDHGEPVPRHPEPGLLVGFVMGDLCHTLAFRSVSAVLVILAH